MTSQVVGLGKIGEGYVGGPAYSLETSVASYAVTAVNLTSLKKTWLPLNASVTSFVVTAKNLTGLFRSYTLPAATTVFYMTAQNLTSLRAARLLPAITQTYTATPINLTSLLATRLIELQNTAFVVTSIYADFTYAPSTPPVSVSVTGCGVPPYARAKRAKVKPYIPAISMQVIRRAREEREEFLVL